MINKIRKIPKLLLVAIAALCLILAVVIIIATDYRGGKIVRLDLINGYNIYIKTDRNAEPTEITDNVIKKDILSLCKKIRCYREIKAAHDILLGQASGDKWAYEVKVFIITDRYGYSLGWINWDYYNNEVFKSLKIRREKKGEPIVVVFRTQLDPRTENAEKLDYIEDNDAPDSLNSKEGYGWYSIMKEDEKEELQSLIGLCR